MRMWEIRENDFREGAYPYPHYPERPMYGQRSPMMGQREMGMKTPEDEIREAYECGLKEGYEKAMAEVQHSSYGSRYGERRGMR